VILVLSYCDRWIHCIERRQFLGNGLLRHLLDNQLEHIPQALRINVHCQSTARKSFVLTATRELFAWQQEKKLLPKCPLKHNRSERVAVLEPNEALPYHIHIYIYIQVSSSRYAKSYLKGLLEERVTVTIRLPGRALKYSTSTDSEDSFTRQNKERSEEDRYWGRTDRIPREKESLRRIQEPEHRTEKIKPLVYLV
jgi:hypothetical protein